MINSSAAQELYEVNVYVELEYPDVIDSNNNQGSGRFERGLPDWNIIFLTELDEASSLEDLLAYVTRQFPEEMNEFLEEHSNAIHDSSFHIESHDSRQEGCYQLDDHEILIEENNAIWEAYS